MSLLPKLRRIETSCRTKAPRAHASLRPPASPADLARLADTCFAGKLPADLAALFAWHDGQSSDGDPLSPESNYTLHSIASALSAHAFLSAPAADIQQPWSASWLPLFENGAGDHLVYDRGALLEYRHDDAGRPVRFASLDAWASEVADALAKLKPKKLLTPARYRWEAAEPPKDKAAVAAMPIGAVFASSKPRILVKTVDQKLVEEQGWHSDVYVRLSSERWLHCPGTGLEVALALDDAIAQWRSFSEKPPSANSGYYLKDPELFAALLVAPGLQRGVEVR